MSWFDSPENTLGSMIYRITVDVVTISKVIMVMLLQLHHWVLYHHADAPTSLVFLILI